MRDSTDLNEFLKQLVHEGVGHQEWKLRIIQWVAQSPTRAIRAIRKQAATEFLDVSQRTNRLVNRNIPAASHIDQFGRRWNESANQESSPNQPRGRIDQFGRRLNNFATIKFIEKERKRQGSANLCTIRNNNRAELIAF